MPTPADVRRVEVVLTAGCNLRCGYCYQNDKKPRRMEWETLRKAADLLLASRHRRLTLLFVGGEPLLEFPLIQQAVEYVERHCPPGKKVQFDILTNGTLLRSEQADYLARHRFIAQLSFDGVPAAQDIRGRGTFVVLDRLLDRLRSDHPRFFARLSVSLTLLPATVQYLPASIDYFLEKGLREVAIAAAFTHQAEWSQERIAELDHAFHQVYRSCLRHLAHTGLEPLVTFRQEGHDPTTRPATRSMCGVDRAEIVAVDVDGQVHGCLLFVPSYQSFPSAFLQTRLEAMRLGGLDSAGLRERFAAYPAAVRAARIFHDKQDKYSSYGRCGECRFLSRCGVCPISIGQQAGNPDPHRVPDWQCAYNLVSLEYRERFRRRVAARKARLPAVLRPTRRLRRLLEAAGMGASR